MVKRSGPVILAIMILPFFLASCRDNTPAGEPVPDLVLTSAVPTERDAAYRDAQALLIGRSSARAADSRIRNAERERTVSDGLIREAIDFSPLTIEYYSVNPGDVLQSTAVGAGGPLQISDFGPAGELPVENRRPDIYVMFNKPMVPLAQLGAPVTESAILSIDPPVEGIYRWYGTKTLGFRPGNPLLDRPRYTVTVSGDATSMDGETLGEEFAFDIFGEKVKMVNLFAGNDADIDLGLYDVPTAAAKEITLEFNQPVDHFVIGESLQVAERGREFPFTVSRPDYPERLESRTDRAVLLTLEKEPPENTTLEITLTAGARPFPDYPGSSKPQTYRLRTIRPFRAERLSAYAGNFPRDNRPSLFPVYLRFSHPLEEGVIPEGFEVRVNNAEVEPEDITVSWSTVAFFLSGIEPGMKVSVTVPSGGIRDIHGRNSPGETESVTIPRPDPMVDFPYQYDGLRHLEAEFPPAVVWSSRNIVEGRFGIGGRENFFDFHTWTPAKSALDLSAARRDTTYFHQEDLSPHLNEQGRGPVFMNYELRKDPSQVTNPRYQWSGGKVAVQVTDLGLTVRAAYDKVLVWVNRLSDGTPVSGAAVSAINLSRIRYSGITDDEGLAVIEIPPGEFSRFFYNRSDTRDDSLHVRAEYGGDLAEMRVTNGHSAYAFGVYNTVKPERAEEARHRIHMFTDRGLYKGGEELALRGIHWLQDPGGFSGYEGAYSIRIREASSGRNIWSAEGLTSSSGGYSERLVLPEELEPGEFIIEYSGTGFSDSIGFRIASFRRVNFQVTTGMDRSDYFHGDTVEAAVRAESLSGGALPSAPYHYFWTRRPVRFRPPGPRWKDWTFGTSAWAREQNLTSGDGTLSGSGTARVSEGTVAHEVTGKAYLYTVETTVEDIDRQVVTSTASAMVHPASWYVGAKFEQGTADGWWSRFVPVGLEVTAAARLVDPQGNPGVMEGRLTVGLIKGEWKSAAQQGLYGRVNTRWEYVEEELWKEEKELEEGRTGFSFSPAKPGQHTLFMEFTDEAGRVSRTEIDFYATGSGWVAQAGRTPQDINLIVDRDIYEPGETARILVQSPVPEGRYLLTIEREGILEEKIISLEGSAEVIEIPVKEEYLPVFYAALSSFTERTGTEDDYFEPDLGKPRDLFGLTAVRVATTPVELAVTAASGKENYGPGEEAEFTVTVTREGRPVEGAEVTVLAVDRGVLDLIDYHVPDPLAYFYNEGHFPLGAIGDDSRRLLLRPVTYEVADLQGGDGRKLEERKDFNPLALFEPAVRTGKDGRVTVSATLPDTLSTYRLTAMALEGTRLGLDESEFKVSNPVNVRTALPRRFRNRDSAAAGVVLTNTTDENVKLSVSVESDILTVAGDSSKEIDIPGRTSVELPFLFEAREKGVGEIRFTILSDILNEVLVEEVTVEQPVVKEAFTTVGVISADAPVSEALVIPGTSAEGYGGLSLAVDSTLYPYIRASLEDILDTPYPSLNERLYMTTADIVSVGSSLRAESLFRDLESRQFPGGGIGYRSPNVEYARPSWYLSVLAGHVSDVLRSEDPGFRSPLDEEGLETYLRGRLAEAAEQDLPSFLAAWTAKVLAGRGAVGPAELSWLFEAEDRLGIAGYAMLTEAYMNLGLNREGGTLYQRLRNLMTIGTQSITLAETYEKADYFSNGEAELALFLRIASLREEDPDLLLRIAGALDRNRHSRRFTSVFDDFWVISGFMELLSRESSGGALSVNVSLAGRNLVNARAAAAEDLSIREGFPFVEPPLADLERDTPLELLMETEGEGPLYFAGTLRYALPVETALPRDEGIEISSTIETLDGVILDESALPLGETLRLRVSLSTLAHRSYLKLTVPIPSGCNVLDASFATTGSYGDAGGTDSESWTRETAWGDEASFLDEGYAGYGPGGWWYWFYRPMQRIYDNAVSYVWEDFYAGRREVTFLIRTTTPGIYPTPPVNAVCEFEPEVFGRGAGKLAIIRGE